MCLAKISRAIADAEDELKAAAKKAEAASPLTADLTKLLTARLSAFQRLQDSVREIEQTLQYSPVCSENPCYPPPKP